MAILHGAAEFAGLLLAAATGFVYVAAVLCDRSDPFGSPPGNRFEFAKLLLGATVLHAAGVRIGRAPGAAAPDARATRIAAAVAFFLGLHWEWAGRLTGARFSLTSHHLASLAPVDAAALLAGLAVLGALAAFHARLARRRSCLRAWLGAIALAAVGIALITWGWRGSRHLHLHHYAWAALLAPFARFPHPVSRVTQAFLFGVFVEGVARWGMDPVWPAP